MRLGYKLLGMVYFDRTSSILLDFSLHHEPGKKKDGRLTQQEKKEQYKNPVPTNRTNKSVKSIVHEQGRKREEYVMQGFQIEGQCGLCTNGQLVHPL